MSAEPEARALWQADVGSLLHPKAVGRERLRQQCGDLGGVAPGGPCKHLCGEGLASHPGVQL
eukprot:10033983-Alexandrium_andersonii.AAC.1